MVKFKDFSRPLSDFPVLFKADVFFKDFSRKPSKFKFVSSLCDPCCHWFGVKLVKLLLVHRYSVDIFSYSGPSGILCSDGKQITT